MKDILRSQLAYRLLTLLYLLVEARRLSIVPSEPAVFGNRSICCKLLEQLSVAEIHLHVGEGHVRRRRFKEQYEGARVL